MGGRGQANALSHQVSWRPPQTPSDPAHSSRLRSPGCGGPGPGGGGLAWPPCLHPSRKRGRPTEGRKGRRRTLAGMGSGWTAVPWCGPWHVGLPGGCTGFCVDPGVEGGVRMGRVDCYLELFTHFNHPSIHPSPHADGALCWPAQAGSEMGRPEGRATRAWQPPAWVCWVSHGGWPTATGWPASVGELAHTPVLPLQLEQFIMMRTPSAPAACTAQVRHSTTPRQP